MPRAEAPRIPDTPVAKSRNVSESCAARFVLFPRGNFSARVSNLWKFREKKVTFPLGTPWRGRTRYFRARGKRRCVKKNEVVDCFSAVSRVPFGCAMSMLAFESPIAAVFAFEPGHSHPRTIFEMAPPGTRRTPAPAEPAVPTPAADAATPAPAQTSPPIKCLCGEIHTAGKHWQAGHEDVRLVEVFVSEIARDHVSRLGSGRTREAMDADLEAPWEAFARI